MAKGNMCVSLYQLKLLLASVLTMRNLIGADQERITCMQDAACNQGATGIVDKLVACLQMFRDGTC